MRLLTRLATAFSLLLAAAGCATTASRQSAPAFYVMRHLDTPAGERDPDLLPEGQRAAILLAGWFGDTPPTAIYVSDFRRTRQTVAPLAARLGLSPIVYDPADTAGLVARIRAERGPVLIVGHSNTVPDIIEQLGGMRPAPLVHQDFGDIWRIGPDGSTARLRIDGD